MNPPLNDAVYEHSRYNLDDPYNNIYPPYGSESGPNNIYIPSKNKFIYIFDESES